MSNDIELDKLVDEMTPHRHTECGASGCELPGLQNKARAAIRTLIAQESVKAVEVFAGRLKERLGCGDLFDGDEVKSYRFITEEDIDAELKALKEGTK